MVLKSVAEQKAFSDQLEARAQEYKKSKQYLDAVAAKRKTRKQSPLPAPIIGDVYGSQEQIRDRLISRYEKGEIPADVSAEIVESKDRPGQYEVYFSETSGFKERDQPSVIRYSSYQDVQQPVTPDAGRFAYDVNVTDPEQARDVRIWAAAHGHTSERIRNTSDLTADQLNKMSPDERRKAGEITVRIYSDTAIPEDTGIDIRSSETLAVERSEKLGRIMSSKIYEKADPIEKVGLHVRTLLSPAGYGYVGSLAKEQGDPVSKVLINLAFPDTKSTEEIVKADIGERTARHSRGVYTYNIAGFDVDERIVSAVKNPVVEVLAMAAGGAGVAKVAATNIGAKVLTSVPGKVISAGVTGLYAGERTGKVLTLRAEGKHSEALGTGITAVAGIGAAATGFKTQYSHIIRARSANIVKVDVKEIKGGSITKTVGKDTSVSRGKFTITEGQLKGLKGDTVSLAGKKAGFQVTKIPAQTVGSGKHKIKIPEQVFRDFTEHGVVSSKLKISYRKAGDMLLSIKGPSGKSINKIVGPRRETALMQEVSKSSGKITISKDIPGAGRVSVDKHAIVRKFSGVSVGRTSKKYDLVLVQKDQKILIAEQSLVSSKHLSKVDWIDVSLAKSGGSGGGSGGFKGHVPLKGSGGTATVAKVAPAVKAATSPPPAPSSLNIKTQAPAPSVAAGTQARIVPNLNPVPMPVRIKVAPAPEEINVQIGTPKIVRRLDPTQRDRTVMARPVPIITNVPAIIKQDTAGDVKIVTTIGTKTLPPTPVTHQITGQRVTQKEATAILTALEPVIDRVPSQPVVTPVGGVPIKPPHIIPNLGMIPFLRMSKGKFNKDKLLKGVKTNPIPDIERVI